MDDDILKKNPGPFTELLIRENKTRYDTLKKKNKIIKDMSGSSPNIKLVQDSKNNISVSTKGNSSMNNINLIRDSDSDSIATAEPNAISDSSSAASTPIKKPVKKANKQFSKLPSIDNEEFQFFTNNKKQKPVVEKHSKQEESEEESEEESDDDESEEEVSDSESSVASSAPREKKPKMSSREIEKKKQELLVKLMALEKKGVNLTKNYSLKSSLEEIEFEYNTQKHAAEVEASVHFQQKILMAVVTGVEFLNKKFDPIGAKLDGWSESVMDNITDYEEIFQKLHEKYSEKTSMPPELQLLITLVGSGFMFHLTNTLFKSALPGLGDVLKSNPDIMQNIMGAMGKAMNNSQGMSPSPPSQSFQPPPQSFQPPPQSFQPSQSFQPPPQSFQPSQSSQQQQRVPEFTGPSVNLSDLMNTYNSGPSMPSVQQAPKMNNSTYNINSINSINENDNDRFSVASSSSNESETKTINLPSSASSSGKRTPRNVKGKSIQIN
jgi:hypothetical protein